MGKSAIKKGGHFSRGSPFKTGKLKSYALIGTLVLTSIPLFKCYELDKFGDQTNNPVCQAIIIFLKTLPGGPGKAQFAPVRSLIK